MPRPDDSAGPPHPRLQWMLLFCLRCTLRPSASGTDFVEAVPALQGARSPLRPTRFSVYAYLTFRSWITPLLIEINTRYGWVANPYPTGTSTPKDTPSFPRRDNALGNRRYARHQIPETVFYTDQNLKKTQLFPASGWATGYVLYEIRWHRKGYRQLSTWILHIGIFISPHFQPAFVLWIYAIPCYLYNCLVNPEKYSSSTWILYIGFFSSTIPTTPFRPCNLLLSNFVRNLYRKPRRNMPRN